MPSSNRLQEMVPKPGDKLVDRYILGDELGRGGFGVVFRATHIGLGEDVAIKVLLPHVLSNPRLHRRFEREIRVVKRLRHPNTIRILDCAETAAGLPFYVMEYIRGTGLHAVLQRELLLSPARTQRITIQILKSLREAHGYGVVHRDLKPENILLCQIVGEDDFVKLLDFGIAKALFDPSGRGGLTSVDQVIGTPNYMAPEQAVGSADIDARCDIYAVGLIIAECLSGQTVVAGDSMLRVLSTHASEAPLTFCEQVVTSPLFPIIERACAKAREDRFPSAAKMIESLESLTDLSDQKSTPSLWGNKLSVAVRALTENKDDPSSLPTTVARPDRELSRADTVIEDDQAATVAATGVAVLGDTTRPSPPSPRTTPKRSAWVIPTGFLALLGAAAIAAVMLSWDGGDIQETEVPQPTNSEPGEVPRDPQNTPSETDYVSSGLLVTGPHQENTTDDATATGQPVPQVDNVDPTVLAAAMTALAVAGERVGVALPETHHVRFVGTNHTRVLLGDTTLGVIPFDGPVPMVDREIALRFVRDGYREQTRTVSLTDPEIRVDLRRRHRDRPELVEEPVELLPPATDVTEEEPDAPFGTAPVPFGNAPDPYGATPDDESSP